jgi:hypothetical protein
MPSKLRFWYYALVTLCWVLAFFGFWTWPKSWEAAVSFLAPLETWWGGHAAHPTLAAFFLGLAAATIFIPELWRVARPHLFTEKFSKDISAAEGFNKIVSHSKRAKELVQKKLLTVPMMYESHLTPKGVMEARLRAKLADEIHDLLRAGDLTAWGTPDGRQPYQEITKEEWSDIKIDFEDPDANRDPPFVHAVKRKRGPSGTVFGYVWIQFCSKQLYRVYPLALFPRRMPEGPREKSFDQQPI